MPETLYIIDGHSQIYRAYYAPFRDLTSPTGEPTRATYVFTSMMLRFLAERKPRYVAMAVDGPAEKLHRRRLYADYKATRKPMPEDLLPQIPRILQIVRAMGIPILEAPGYEADDIIATAARRLAGPDMQVVVISRDKDLDQLVGDHVTLLDPMKNETFDAAAILSAKGYTPAQAIEVQTLCGDDVDNIPGIPGVGPKTAAKLIAQYGTAQGVVLHADELTPKLRQNVLAHADSLALARQLVTLDCEVPIELSLPSLALPEMTGQALRPIFAELGFTRLLEQLDQMGVAGGQAQADLQALATEHKQTTAADGVYDCVNTPEALEALVAQLGAVKRLAVDTETTSTQAMSTSLVGISLAWKPLHGVYIPIRGPLGAVTLDLQLVRAKLGPILADETIEKIGQNIKFDLLTLGGAGLDLRGPLFDTMIAAYVLDATRLTYKMDALAVDFLNHRCIPIEDLIGRGKKQTTMDTVPLDVITVYAGEDADVTLRLADALTGHLMRQGLMDLFENLEMPLTPVLAQMEKAGIRVDASVLKQQQVELSAQAQALHDRILALAARPGFNPDSPKQLADLLFNQFNLPVVKKTQTGPSTDAEVLEELAALHELPALILDYRKLTKLINTYLTSLAQCINARTGRVHTSFHQTGAATGRLSSSDPNLQNIPVRTDEGRKIRKAFVADEGCVLLSADYSQVELRVLAHLCEDPTLIEAFQQDQDIHRIVAAEVFAVSPAEVTPEMRSRAKTVNFGIIYGQTAFGLARTLRIGREEAGEFIRKYRQRFPRIEDFLQACVAKARRDGYVETLVGRRRAIADIDSRNAAQRNLAERLAINSVVQGSAADLIKLAMLNIARRIEREGHPSRMLLQIHDELVFEIPQEALESQRAMIVHEMNHAIAMRVPLKVETGAGRNWMEAK